MYAKSFHIQQFGPIADANIEFGNLTILTGPQASGKSMFLEMLKLIIDKNHILENLKKYNYIVNKYDSKNILEIYFGEGMEKSIRTNTSIKLECIDKVVECDSKRLLERIRTPNKKRNVSEKVFYVPAQRIMGIDDGRYKHFMEFGISTPYVLRNFSETLRIFIQGGLGNPEVIFPLKNRLKSELRNVINESVFHGAEVVIDETSGQRKMKLEVNRQRIPFMAWSAGQKEFMPLLISFYCLSKIPNNIVKKDDFKIVILEEPEMGLHPKAMVSVIVEILDLLTSGYQVIISTHSAIFLEFAWAFNILISRDMASEEFRKAMCDLLCMSEKGTVAALFESLTSIQIRTYMFSHDENNATVACDISTLDPGSDDKMVAEWGGLSGFASKSADVVWRYAEE